jgi:glyoxylase-like metal-dependent hydrolase (beta-lactamase superfamily II)
MEVARGLHRLTAGIVNWYLLEDGGKITLVDAGAPRDWDLLLSTLQGLGRRLDDVDAVLLTHAHSDHTGFAERARTAAGATVWVHDAEVAVAKSGKSAKGESRFTRHLVRPEAYRTMFGLMRRGALRIVPIVELSTFNDDDTIDVPGKPRVLHVPGHTAGSSAVWFEDRSALCTGDALVTRNVMTGRIGAQVMPAALNQSSAQALTSLDRIADTRADVVLPGHGEPWAEGVEAAVLAARRAGVS